MLIKCFLRLQTVCQKKRSPSSSKLSRAECWAGFCTFHAERRDNDVIKIPYFRQQLPNICSFWAIITCTAHFSYTWSVLLLYCGFGLHVECTRFHYSNMKIYVKIKSAKIFSASEVIVSLDDNKSSQGFFKESLIDVFRLTLVVRTFSISFTGTINRK